MNSVDNPYTPGAGTPPPELAGRESILKKAEDTIKRTKKGKAAKSFIKGDAGKKVKKLIDQMVSVLTCNGFSPFH